MNRLSIGVIVSWQQDPEPALRQIVELGLRSCQVAHWNVARWTPAEQRGCLVWRSPR